MFRIFLINWRIHFLQCLADARNFCFSRYLFPFCIRWSRYLISLYHFDQSLRVVSEINNRLTEGNFMIFKTTCSDFNTFSNLNTLRLLSSILSIRWHPWRMISVVSNILFLLFIGAPIFGFHTTNTNTIGLTDFWMFPKIVSIVECFNMINEAYTIPFKAISFCLHRFVIYIIVFVIINV